MKRSIFITLFSLLFSAQTYGWVISADFENGTIGEKAKGTDAFDGAKSLTVFDNTRAVSGSQSAKATITEGSDGWTEWGGVWNFRSYLHEGDELWYRFWVWLEPDWGWNKGSKGSRIHTMSSTGVNEGYHDTLVYDNTLRVGSEVSPRLFTDNNGQNQYLAAIPRGSWQCIEIYIKFHSVPGKAIERVWRNGELVFEDTKTNTLRSSSSYSNLAFLFGYFDEAGAPHTQSLWIDNVVLTNQRPDKTDSHGNPFIGTGQTKITDSKYIAPPNAPTILQ